LLHLAAKLCRKFQPNLYWRETESASYLAIRFGV
jgi:hypothetical protein